MKTRNYLFLGLIMFAFSAGTSALRPVTLKTFSDTYWLTKATETAKPLSLEQVPRSIVKACIRDYHTYPITPPDKNIWITSAWKMRDGTHLCIFEISNVFGPLVVYSVDIDKSALLWKSLARVD